MTDLWFDTLSLAAEHYSETMTEAALNYVYGRGVSYEVATLLNLGSGNRSKPLYDALPSDDHRNMAEEVGLLRGDGTDRMINRLTFPIEDEMGRVVGITGRAVVPEIEMRYLTTHRREDRTGAKSTLYGIKYADIRSKGFLFLVEGPLDLAVAWSAGVTNLVSGLGTNLSAKQRKLLARVTPRVKLLFDALDPKHPKYKQKRAEEKKFLIGTEKRPGLVPRLRELGLIVTRVKLPPGKDPADYFKERITK